ncbi:hypothetical protein [Methylobacterium brachythecii]|uniref:Uncharacterized protein n=1 Tax=Methylobacterium brachythecii TaxID=1176177 RepID=A0A7W6AM88_9HYPH|nr:hypothetical protein [Methylobacterium brachythecii]MBB3905203.1 hypothetical protein [Methylobacterium brachythecii]GLS46225.1 hypothetical protein GCM10007884_42170 [Methylobacterium brachythecii]
MSQTVDLKKPAEAAPTLLTIDDVQRLIAQSRETFDEHRRPINVQINLGDERRRGRGREDEVGFSLVRSKFVWLVVAISISYGAAYLRTRYVCQSFKDTGRFFYGMGVDRCVGVLMKQPFEQVQAQLETINRSY